MESANMNLFYFYAKIKTWFLRSMQYAGVFSLTLSVYNTVMLKYMSTDGNSFVFGYGLSLENLTIIGIALALIVALIFGSMEFALVGSHEYEYSWSKTPMAVKLCNQVNELYEMHKGDDNK
jgi:hypothetical protein